MCVCVNTTNTNTYEVKSSGTVCKHRQGGDVKGEVKNNLMGLKMLLHNIVLN